ncbi:response regulator [Pelosinus sp. IPA-1]|uniref:response regulator n=1 Tax=Pelosinus sp. IPA-1 TaxID=3029569 RepID=UPI0024362762|nr:response regulator [Pelosinus sp. IPA-1]GMA98549.1 transcriptional regulatory protein MalR [Pelosinus sp. IPA-1]
MIKVLIVDDDPMVAEFNRRYVELVEGFKIEAIVHSANEALEILNKVDVDLILLDIFMPGMNGLDLLIQLRQVGKGVDVIVITAACDRHSIKKALQFGAVDYIIKPFEFERLNSALLAYKGLANLMEDQDRLSQVELDQCVLYKEQPLSMQLPKGIDRNTLNVTWEQIKELDRSLFSTEEMAKYIGISRVSMRKYLEFLRQIGSLKLELIYGTVGRPVYKYRCVNSVNNHIKRYL